MKKLSLILLLALASPAAAQTPQQQRFQNIIANMVGENVELATRLEAATEQLAAKSKEVEDLKKKLEAATKEPKK